MKGKEPKLKHMQQWIRDVLQNKVEFLTANDDTTQRTPPQQQQQPQGKQEL
jgi:hypothetical protein